MSGLAKLITSIAPPPPAPLSREYDGLEYRWKIFSFRPALFKFEGAIFAVVGIYLLIYLVGKYVNNGRARSTIAPYQSLLNTQFKQVRPLLTSSPSLHLLYSTGRRNVLALHTTINLLPIHDIAGLAIHFVKSIIEPTYNGNETINFNFTLGKGELGLQGEGLGVWGVVDKSALRETREKRWDLTFPKLNDSAAGLPITHALFTEHVEITDILLKTPNIGISEVINDKDAASVLKYLLITDVPSTRPTKGSLPAKFRSRQIILSLYKPTTPAQVDAVKAWIQVSLNIVDLLGKKEIVKPEITRKLIKTRQLVDEDLNKDYTKELNEDKEPELTADEKRAIKKKEQREKLSEKELKKLEELEKKREMRKLQKKQALGGGR